MKMNPSIRGTVGFHVPSWPLADSPNGIVSYVVAVRAGLDDLGVGSVLFVPREHRPGEVFASVARPTSVSSRMRRAFDRVRGVPDPLMRETARTIARAVRAEAQRGLALFEMEETLGIIDTFRVPGVARVARLHGPWFLNGPAVGAPEDDDFRERVRLEGIAIERADAVSAPSEDVLARTREYYGIELPRARVVPNPGPAVQREQTWRAERANANRVLFVGRFDRHKGGDVVVDAFAQLAGKYPDLEFVFAGPDRGLLLDDGSTTSLEQYVSTRVPVEFRTRLQLLGQTTPERITELRLGAALCVLASRYENFAMAALEAAAFGCPIVAARSGGTPEIVAHERTGLLVSPGDPIALANGVERYLSRPEEAAAFGAAARRDYEARFTPPVVASAMVDFYSHIPGVRLGPAAR